jgi:hypothetical protein
MLKRFSALLLPLLVSQSGDRVVYSKYAGTDVQVAGEEHVLLKVGCCMQHISMLCSAQQPGMQGQHCGATHHY